MGYANMSDTSRPTSFQSVSSGITSSSHSRAHGTVVPFGIIGFYRYFWYIIRLLAWGTYRPIPLPENPTYVAEEDVTIIVPTIDAGEEFRGGSGDLSGTDGQKRHFRGWKATQGRSLSSQKTRCSDHYKN